MSALSATELVCEPCHLTKSASASWACHCLDKGDAGTNSDSLPMLWSKSMMGDGRQSYVRPNAK
jgi:hypothetical protein